MRHLRWLAGLLLATAVALLVWAVGFTDLCWYYDRTREGDTIIETRRHYVTRKPAERGITQIRTYPGGVMVGVIESGEMFLTAYLEDGTVKHQTVFYLDAPNQGMQSTVELVQSEPWPSPPPLSSEQVRERVAAWVRPESTRGDPQ